MYEVQDTDIVIVSTKKFAVYDHFSHFVSGLLKLKRKPSWQSNENQLRGLRNVVIFVMPDVRSDKDNNWALHYMAHKAKIFEVRECHNNPKQLTYKYTEWIDPFMKFE